MIVLEDIVKHYGAQKVLDKVSFSIDTGEIVGFLGPNGAGKSTTMKVITGFVTPDAGKVTINNIPVMPNSIQHKNEIGYLPENNPLYHDMYVAEYLRFVAGMYKLNNVKDRVSDVINRIGLLKEHHKKIGALSKGYRQRVGLAQAIIHEPKVLILDEPTTGLDPNQIEEVRELIQELAKSKTILLSTHILQEVQALCSRTIIINNGKIVADEKFTNADDNLQASISVQFLHRPLLEQLDLLGQVEMEDADKFIYRIHSKKENLAELVFDFAVETQNKTLAIQSYSESIDRKFKALTQV